MASTADQLANVATPNAVMRDPADNIDTSHRRIDLQSPADLFFLLNNVHRAARSKIDLHLPLEAALREGTTGVDEMRSQVEARVNSYIDETFEMAKTSISINGIEAEKVAWEKEVPEEFEPYDHELANRIATMHSTIEGLHLSLANTRREAAARAAQNFQTKFTAQSEQIDTALSKLEEDTSKVSESQGAEISSQIHLEFGDRQEDVKKTWEEALAGLSSLQSSLNDTKDRAEGATKVLSYLEGKT